VIRSVLHSPWRRGLGVLILFGMVALVGCSNKKPVGSITGTVKYKGQPVTSGSINFYDSGRGMAADSKLDGSGNYSITELEVGTYKVYIQPPVPEQLPPGTPPKKEKFDVPAKFQDPARTPISKEVKAGKNDIPVELTD
jgi:hypothetical protein